MTNQIRELLYSYDYSLNRTPLGPITITYHYYYYIFCLLSLILSCVQLST